MTTTAPTLIRDPWRRVWHFFASDGFYAAAIIVSAALLLIAGPVPQTPGHNPIAYSRWLSDAQTRFGSLFDLLNTLGLFAVTGSLLFRLALALLGWCSALRAIDQLDRLRQANRPAIRRSALAAILAYAGTLITLFGLGLAAFIDYRADNLIVQPGAVTNIPGTAYTVRLDSIEGDRATVALLRQSETIAQGVIAEKQPLRGSMTVYLDQIGPALTVSATRGATQTLNLQNTANSPAQPQVLLLFTPDQNEGFVAAPQVNLVLRIDPAGQGQFNAQIYQNAAGKDFGNRLFKPGESITVEDTTFHFEPAAYIVASLANQPSHWIVLIGVSVMVLGLLGLLLWPIESAATRRDRVAVWLVRFAWLGWTILIGAQVIAVYPRAASFGNAIVGITAELAAWLLLSGSIMTYQRARILLLMTGLAAAIVPLFL